MVWPLQIPGLEVIKKNVLANSTDLEILNAHTCKCKNIENFRI